jgi:hypothetical protein
VEVGVGLSLLVSENRIAHATNDLRRRIIGALIYALFCPVSVTYYLKRSHNISVLLFFHDRPPLCAESRLSKSTSTDMAKWRKQLNNLAPSIKTLKYGPVSGTCTIIDLPKQDIEKLLDMTERAMKIPGVMMGQETLGVIKMVISYVTFFCV